MDFEAPSDGSSSRGARPRLQAGFSIADIAANPSDYYVNVHNAAFPGGAAPRPTALINVGSVAATDQIEEYLAGLPEERRHALQALREAIAAAAPEAVEAISYGAPAFRYGDRPLVCYSNPRKHLSFFPMSPGVIEAHRDDLSAWSLSKGTIRFTPDNPLPAEVVATIVRARIAEVDDSRR